ncbi:MAG: hypothetical protein Q9186_000969 [Xanthomendoza sp. 1 TL-2023]
MLPQFYIRNLQSPLDQTPDPSAPPVSGAQSLTIRISTNEYDELLVRYPPAALNYMDNEDGEIVRVGSSLELAQRLEDPVSALARIGRQPKPGIRRTRGAVTDNKTLSILSQYHTFDIDPSNDVQKIWTGFRERTRLFPALFLDPSVLLASKVLPRKQERRSPSEALQENQPTAPLSDAKGDQWPSGSQVRHHSTSTNIHLVDHGTHCRSHYFDGTDLPTVQPADPKLPSETSSPFQINPNIERTSVGPLPSRGRATLRKRGIYCRRPTSVLRQDSPSYQEGYVPRMEAYNFIDDTYLGFRPPRTSVGYPITNLTIPLPNSSNHPHGLEPEEQERVCLRNGCTMFRTLEQHQQGSHLVNITRESKGRTQAAGDKGPAKNIPSNDWCISATENKPTEYQTQRALCGKSPALFFREKSWRDTLTAAEDKQNKEQTASGESQERIKSVRYPGNRWPSYSQGRPQRLDNRSGESSSIQNTKTELGQSTNSMLIDVFDKELARLSTTGLTTSNDPVSESLLKPLSGPLRRPSRANTTTETREEVTHSMSDRIQHLSSALQSLNHGSERANSPAVPRLQHDIHTALWAFCTSIKEIAEIILAGPVATASGTASYEKIDELALEKTIEDLEGMVSLVQMQLLPLLQKHVEQPLHKVSKQAATPALPGFRGWIPASKQPSEPLHSLHLDNPVFRQADKFLPTNDTQACRMSRGSSTAAPSRLSDCEIGSMTPDPQVPFLSGLAKTNSRLPQCSRSSERRPFTGIRGMTAASSEDNVSLPADCRFPTLEHFERDVSPAFHEGVENHPSMMRANRQCFSRINALQAQKIYPTVKELQPATSTTGAYLSRMDEVTSTSPNDSMAPSTGYICPVKPSSSTRDGYTDWYGRPQSPTINASDGNAIPEQQDRSVRCSLGGQVGLCNTIVDAQAVHGTDQVYAGQSNQSQSQGDRRISDTLAEANYTDHCDAATVARTQACVEQLLKLGFGLAAEGGCSRLVIYAQAAGGDLIEAIDMISEERQAYDQGPQRRFLA